MANTQTYNVNMKFNADMSQLNQQLTNLKVSLTNLATIDTKSLGVSKELKAASVAAKELRGHMANALNPQTGQLDLSRLSASLKASGKDLGEYSRTLLNAGAQGQDTFNKMATAISGAQQPLKTSNKLLNSMMTSFKNVVRYQISSRIYMGFVSSIREAYTYAQDLNKAMTDIRMVTGLTKDEADALAGSFNKVAKELKASTLDIAQGSKIFLQQGDSIDLAMKKNVIATKAAKVAGLELSQMTENLTALWNSYQVSEEQMGSYADKLAALGAYTATSFEEISTAVTKVGATANAVGVNIDQLGATIATVSSVTRESAETTGTAFKTIYARMTDLSLGETLEDGVDLGKVSSALESIGVDILDDNNKLIETGTIVEQLGNKWETLTEAQKTATAQVVAGKRQYTQLMALFENWDMYKNNLSISMEGVGAIDEQYKTWQEGWLGAKNKVEANLEELYVKIFDDDAFIGMTNGIADAIGAINGLIDGFGGLTPILTQLGALGLAVFQTKISGGIQSAYINLQQFLGISTKQDLQMRQSLTMILQEAGAYENLSQSYKNQLLVLEKINNLKTAYYKVENSATETQKNGLLSQIQLVEQLGTKWVEAARRHEEYVNAEKNAYSNAINQGFQNGIKNKKGDLIEVDNSDAAAKMWKKTASITIGSETITGFDNILNKLIQEEQLLQKCVNLQEKWKNSTNLTEAETEELKQDLMQAGVELKDNVTDADQLLAILKQAANQPGIDLSEIQGKYQGNHQINLGNILKAAGLSLDEFKQSLIGMGVDGAIVDQLANKFTNLSGNVRQSASSLELATAKLTSFATTTMNLSTIIMQVNNLIKTFNNENATTSEKLMALLSFVPSALMTLVSTMNLINNARKAEIVLQGTQNGLLTTEVSLRTIINALTGNWQGLAVLGIAAIGGIVYALGDWRSESEKLADETKRLEEVAEESKKKYEEANSELSDTTSELENVRKKIEELESKNSLTLVEQEELKDLKDTENTLEDMLETLKEIAEIELSKKLNDEVATIKARWAEEDAGGKWSGVYANMEDVSLGNDSYSGTISDTRVYEAVTKTKSKLKKDYSANQEDIALLPTDFIDFNSYVKEQGLDISAEYDASNNLWFLDKNGKRLSNELQAKYAAEYAKYAKKMEPILKKAMSENPGEVYLEQVYGLMEYASNAETDYIKIVSENKVEALQDFNTIKQQTKNGVIDFEAIKGAYKELADAFGGEKDLGFLNIFVDGIIDQADGLMKDIKNGMAVETAMSTYNLTEEDLQKMGIPSQEELETIAINYYSQGFKRIGITDEETQKIFLNSLSETQLMQMFSAQEGVFKGIEKTVTAYTEALKKAGYQTGVFANNVDALDSKMETFKKSAEAVSDALTDLATGEGLTLEKLEALEEVFKDDPEASGIIAELYTLVAQGAGVDALTAKVKELSGEIASLSGLNDINVFNEGSYNEVKALKAKIQLQYKSMNVTNAEAMANQALEKQIGANVSQNTELIDQIDDIAKEYGVSAEKARTYAAEAVAASDMDFSKKLEALDKLGVKYNDVVLKVDEYIDEIETANDPNSLFNMIRNVSKLEGEWQVLIGLVSAYNTLVNGKDGDSVLIGNKKFYVSNGRLANWQRNASEDTYYTPEDLLKLMKEEADKNLKLEEENSSSEDPIIGADPEEVKEHQKKLADIKKKIAEKEAEYLKKVAEKEEEIFKKQQENETEELKEQIEMRKTLLERFNDEIDLLDWGIDFVDESDFSTKLNLTSQKLSVTTRNVERLKNEYEALKNTQTKTGEQAQAISERMAEIGEEWRENVKNMKEYSLEMWTLGFDGLKSVLDKQNTLFDKVFGNISENIEKIKGLNDDEEEFNIDFYGTGGLNLFDYIMPKEVADSIEQRKKEDKEYYSEQKEVVKETADANLETTKQLYDETKTERDKEVEDLKKDLQEIHDEWAKEKEELLQEYNEALGKASSNTTTTTTQIKKDVESVGTTTKETTKTVEKINDIKMTDFDKTMDDSAKKVQTLIDKLSELANATGLFEISDTDLNGLIQSITRIEEKVDKIGAGSDGGSPVTPKTVGTTLSLENSEAVKNQSRTGNCVLYARARSKEITGYSISANEAPTINSWAKTLGSNLVKSQTVEQARNNLIPGAIIAMNAGTMRDKNGNLYGHVVVVEQYDPNTDTLYYTDNNTKGQMKAVNFADYFKAKSVNRVVNYTMYATGTPFGNAQAKNLGIAGENYKPEILIDKKTGKKTYIDEPTVINLDDTDVIGEKQTAVLPKFATGTKIDPAEIAKYIRQKYPEITDAGIAALLGNIKYESDFNYKASVNERYGSGSNKIVRRAGLFQLDTDRISNIYDIVDNGSWQQQIDAVIAESHHSGTGYDAYSKILTNKNIGASEAAKLWDKKYERSAGKTRNERGQAAEWYLENIVNDLSTLQEIKKNTEETAENTLTKKDTYKQIMDNIANEIAKERDESIAEALKQYDGDDKNPNYIQGVNLINSQSSIKEVAKLSDLLLGYVGATPESAQESDIVKMINDAIVHNGGKAIITSKEFKTSIEEDEKALREKHARNIQDIDLEYMDNFSEWSEKDWKTAKIVEDERFKKDMADMYTKAIEDYKYKVPIPLRDSNYLETLKTMRDSYLPIEELTGTNRFEKEIEKLQKEQLQIGFDIRSNSRYYDQKTGKAKTDKFATLEEFMSGEKDNYSIFGSLEDEAATYTMGQAANLARKTIETADNWLKTAVEENNGEITEEIQNKYEEFVGDARDTLSDFSEELNSILSTGLKAASNYFEETLLPQEKIEAMMGDTNFEDAFAEIPKIIETTRDSLKSAMEIAGASQEEIDEALKQFDEEMAPALENKYRKEFFDANYSQAKDYISENITDSSKLTGSHVVETVERMYTTAVEEYNKATAAGDSELAEYWQGVIEEMDSQEYLKTMIENSKRQDFEDWQEILDASKDLADTQIEYLNIENHLVEKRFNLEEKLLDKEREINKELKKSMSSAAWLDEETRKALFDTESYDSVMEEITSIREQANKLDSDLEANIAAIKADTSLSLEERQALLKDLQSDYDNQYEVLEKSFGIAEKELAIAKAKVELNNTLNNKNQMMFINGAWVNVADMEAVQKAQDALVDAEYESDRAKRDKSNTEKLNINEDKASELTKNASYAQATLNKELKAFEEALEDLEPRVQTFKELADDLLTGDYLNKYPELIPLAGPMVTGRTKGKTLGDVVGWGSGEKLKANAFKTEIANLIKGDNDVLLGNLGYTFEQLYKLPTNILDQITSGEWADVFKHEESIPTDFLKKATAYFEGHLEEPPVISIGEMIIRPQDIGYSAMMDGLRSIIPISKTNN